MENNRPLSVADGSTSQIREALGSAVWAADVVLVQDATGAFIAVHSYGADVYGWTIGADDVRDTTDFVHPGDVERARMTRLDVLKHGGRREIEVRLRAKSGRWLVNHVTVALLDEQQRLTVAAVRDISAARASADALSLQVELRSLIGNAPDICSAWALVADLLVHRHGFDGAIAWERIDGEPSDVCVRVGGEPGDRRALDQRTDEARERAIDAAWHDGRPAGIDELGDRVLLPLVRRGETIGVLEVVGAGSTITADVFNTLVDATAMIGGSIQRKRDEAEHQLVRDQSTLAFDHAPIGMALVGLDGSFLRGNEAMCRLLQRPESELLNTGFQPITHPDDLEKDLQLLARLLAGEIPRYRLEKRYLTPSGGIVWGDLSVSLVSDGQGQPVHFVAQVVDITARKDHEQRLEYLAHHDQLTGLANRGYLVSQLETVLENNEAGEASVGVLYLDLDNFKQLNDTRGHQAGDSALRELATRLRSALGPNDLIGRIGGDEFVAVIDHLDPDTAEVQLDQIASRVRQSVAESDICPATSVGSVVVSRAFNTVDEILSAADTQMYRDKARRSSLAG